jgi:hypothetical protein
LIMFTKTYVAAVGTPLRVDMGRCRCIAWYARKMKDIESSRKIGGFASIFGMALQLMR